MYTLADFIALNKTPDMRVMVIENMRHSSMFLDTAIYQPIKSGAVRYTTRNTFPTTAARALNGALPAESTGTFNTMNEFLSIYDGNGRIDKAFQRLENESDLDGVQRILYDQSVSITKTIERDMFQGVGFNDLLGLNARIAAIGGDQLFAIAANGLDITTSEANARAGLSALEELASVVAGPSNQKVFVVNRQTMSRLNIAANIAGNQFYTDKNMIGSRLQFYNNIPFIIIEEDAQGLQILPTNEVQGGSGAVCSSIYCLRWEMNLGLTLLTREGADGFPFDMYTDIIDRVPGTPFSELLIETYVGLAVKRNDSVARCTGIIIA